MAETPTGIFSLPVANMRALVAACHSWQQWTGTNSAAEAANRVYLFDIPAPARGDGAEYDEQELGAKRPFCRVAYFELVASPGGNAWQYDRVAEQTYAEEGKLLVDFVADYPQQYADSPADAIVWFCNKVGAVLKDMLTLAGKDASDGTTHLSVHRHTLYQGPWRNDITRNPTQGDTLRVQFIVDYGI